MKIYIVILIAQILAGLNAGLSFSLLESRYVAALWAGSVFLLLGCGIATAIWRKRKWRSVLFWVAVLHIVIFSIPLLGSRILDPVTPFEDMTFWGIAGPEFHKISERFYSIFILVTVLEGLWAWRAARTAAAKTTR